MDRISYELLSELKKYKSLSLSEMCKFFDLPIENMAELISHLRKNGYVKISDYDVAHYELKLEDPIPFGAQREITMDAIIAIDEYQSSMKANRWKEFRAWITLAIAIAAFIKSFFG